MTFGDYSLILPDITTTFIGPWRFLGVMTKAVFVLTKIKDFRN